MRNKQNIKYYFIADIISQLGSNIALISLNWFLIEKTNSSQQVGILVLVGVIAGFITCPFAGILADRFSRKSILIYSNYARGFLILLITILLLGDFNIYYLYMLSIISGVGFNIYLPASKAFLQEMIKEKSIIKWNAFIEINVQISMLVAGGLTGFMYKTFGIYIILAIDAMTFLIASILLHSIKYSKFLNARIYENFVKEFYNGFVYLFKKPVIFLFLIIMLLPQVVSIISNIVLPGYVMQHLLSDSVTYGILSMNYGIGASIICLIYIAASYIYFNRYILPISFAISAFSLLCLIFSKTILISYIAMLLFGFANSSIKIILLSTMMRVVDKAYMGRVMSSKNLIITSLQMILSYSIGIGMDKYGAPIGYIVLEIIIITSAMSYLIFRDKFHSLFSTNN